MLPKNAIVIQIWDVVYWKNETFLISVDEAGAIGTVVRDVISNSRSRLLLVDNRTCEGRWPYDIELFWVDHMKSIVEGRSDLLCATIANRAVVEQINRLAQESGTYSYIKAFETLDEGKRFLEVPGLPIE